MINFKDKIIWSLIILLILFAIGLSLVIIIKMGTEKGARDTERIQELKQVQSALESYYKQAKLYPQGTFFSIWDSNYSHNTNYWSGGEEPWSTAFYDALVGNGYLDSLPLDPANSEGGDENYLGDAPVTDQGYIYWSDNGQHYILGTNLEKGGVSPDNWGNYQIKGGKW
ncbi:MAG: hypothetical protein AAB361_02435 [Patescibacteria group bacterium]